MRIKKYENASSPIERQPYKRNYQWRIMPQTDIVYNDYNTGFPVQTGDKVWTDENGNIVTVGNNPNAAADYAVQYGNPTFELGMPEITIEGLGNGKSRGHLTGESFEDRYARLLAAPIAKNVDVDNTFKEQAQWQHGQSKEKHEADVKAADARANQLTPGAGTFVVAPLALTAAGIGGATLAPFLAPGTIGGNIIGTTAFGEALNHAMKYGTGKTLGEHAVNAARYLGIPENQWGDFGIQMIGDLPFYITGDLVSKQVANAGRTLTKEALNQLALDNTFKGIPINPTTKDLAKAINESVDKQSLYTPSILHKFDNPYQITKVSGDKIRLRLPSHTQEKPREIVLVPHGNNQYELHIRTWNGDHVPANLDPKEKQALFESVYNELPEGAEILFPESSADYPATRGTVAALTHLSRDPRFQRGNTTGTLIYTDKDGNLQTFTGNSFIKGQELSEREKLLQQVRDLNSQVQGKDVFEVFGTPQYKEAEKLIKQINESEHPIDQPLNWSSKNWFVSRPKGQEPTAEEIAEFEANIPEYLEIQKNAGENWLKMPDGSIWQGDPREWVMMQSKAYKDFMKDSKFTTPMTHLMSDFRGDRVIEVPSTGAGRLWGNGFYGYINPTGKLNTSVSTTSSTYPIVAAEPQSTFVVNAKNPITLSYKDQTPRVLDLNSRHSTDRVGSFHNLSFEGSGPYLENDIGIAPKGKAVIGFPNDHGIAYPLLKFVTGNTGRFSKDPNSSQFRSILPFILGGPALYGITSNQKGGKLIPRNNFLN